MFDIVHSLIFPWLPFNMFIIYDQTNAFEKIQIYRQFCSRCRLLATIFTKSSHLYFITCRKQHMRQVQGYKYIFLLFFPLKLFHTLFQHQKVLFSCFFFRKNNMRKRLETGRKIKQKLNSNVGRTNSTREWTSVGCRKLCIVKIEIFIYEFRPMLYPFLYSSHSTQLLLVLFMMSKYINFRHPVCLKNIKATQK